MFIPSHGVGTGGEFLNGKSKTNLPKLNSSVVNSTLCKGESIVENLITVEMGDN